jgi:predicted MFS family arabinose efflux permease
VAIAGNFGFSAVIFFSALYLQDQLQLAPLQAGMAMLSFSVCFVLTLPLAGSLLRRAGPGVLMAVGLALMTAASLMFLPGGLFWLVLALGVAGIGQGFAFNTSTTAAMDAVPATRSGEASGVLNAARQLGSILGIAIAGAVFQSLESRGLLEAARSHVALDGQQVALIRALYTGSSAARSTLAGLAPGLHAEIAEVMTTVFDASFRGAMVSCAVVSVAGVLIALRVRRVLPPAAA